ncbi:MAG: ATP-binding cassette domain-containing protein, partial [Tannerella sp.]|nr:ATP-binding cassette domain-containing protein [Tannerella sp.]
MSFLTIRNLCVSYGNTVAINKLTLLVERGSIYSFIGPSGCGKSTLLKAICGIVRPASGEISLRDEPIDPRKQSFGYIPQHYGLLDWLTVKNNLALGKKIRKTSSDQESRILEQLEITDLLNRYPASLSGGQQQRVALARAWMLQP